MMDLLQRLQHSVAGQLSTFALFEHCAIFIARPLVLPDGTAVDAPAIQNAIQNALAGVAAGDQIAGNITTDPKPGAAAIVLMPRIDCWEPNARDVQDQIRITIRIVVNQLINQSTQGTGVSAEAYAIDARQRLHWWSPEPGITLKPQPGGTVVPVGGGDDNEVIYEVHLYSEIMDDVPARAKRPTISVSDSPAAGTVTLACETAGAAIYYTTDGTAPFPNNGNAQLYSAPFLIGAAQLLKAAAFKTGLDGSDVAAREFP